MNRNTKTLLVSSGNGPGECRQAVGHIINEMLKEASLLSVEVDIAQREAKHGPISAIIVISGRDALKMASRWEGVIQWKCQSSLRPQHRRKNWFVQVFTIEEAVCEVTINPSQIDMQAIRAGGPGGQHQNKTASAIRAKWVSPQGRNYSVVVRDERSQHRNRSIAVARLGTLVAIDQEEARLSRKGTARHLHHQLERGNPSRVYEGPRFKAS